MNQDNKATVAPSLRRPTREVMVGNVGVGGSNPVRIQSMTTTSTRDIEATVEQVVRLADAGCEIARVTVQGIKEAQACEGIKNLLVKRGYTIPLVADIHFFPPAAMTVADFVDKVRINPGNFVDKRATFKVLEYDNAAYQKELDKIEEKLTPLVLKCKQLKRAVRIGTNHGSLSDRIMNRYGDTPAGMVESALEFARVCRKHDFHDLIFSMKASNTLVMIEAYRLLAAKMDELGWDYPLHLGVTEAGEGEDGRVKSAIGMGSLLLDGLGDTVRVSLTEDPWHEIDPCRRLATFAEEAQKQQQAVLEGRRETKRTTLPFLHRDGTVIAGGSQADAAFVCAEGGKVLVSKEGRFPVYDLSTAGRHRQKRQFDVLSAPKPWALEVKETDEDAWQPILELRPNLILFNPSEQRVHATRKFSNWLRKNQVDTPLVLAFSYDLPWDDLVIHASAEIGSLLCDGVGDGLFLRASYDQEKLEKLAFNILQGARMRTTKTEFISCPSCGRTLFNLQEVAKKIRERTCHLAGVKIAIMGCIVNGPGEMADADFGYVGSKPGMIDLYVGKECVERNIDFDEAPDRLVSLIQAHGRWVDPAGS